VGYGQLGGIGSYFPLLGQTPLPGRPPSMLQRTRSDQSGVD
jgi:hypothetical protein